MTPMRGDRREFIITMMGLAAVASGCEDSTGSGDDDDGHGSVDVLNRTNLSLVNVVCSYKGGGTVTLANLSPGGTGHFTGVPVGPITVTAASQASLSTTFRATGTLVEETLLVLTLQ